MNTWNREQVVSEFRAATLLQPLMPDRNAAHWLAGDRSNNPNLPTITRSGAIHYFATDTFRLAKLLARNPRELNAVAIALRLDRRAIIDRRSARPINRPGSALERRMRRESRRRR